MPSLGAVLILDTETTGLTPQDGTCIEVGAILFSVTHRSVISQLSFLMPCLTNEAQHVNGIDPVLTMCSSGLLQKSLELFEDMVRHADAVVAHNAEFDRQWFGVGGLPAVELPWICTMSDMSWPGVKSRTGLATLALAHGVPVWAAHRALTDCIYIAQVFERCDDLQGKLNYALMPKVRYQALVGFAERQLAKDAGFAWDGNQKTWTKKLTEADLLGLPFAVKVAE